MAPRHRNLIAFFLLLFAVGAFMLLLSLNRTMASRPVPPLDDCLYLGQEWDDRTPYEVERYGKPGRYALWDCGQDGVIRVPLP